MFLCAGIRLGTESEKKPGIAVVRSLRKLGASLGSLAKSAVRYKRNSFDHQIRSEFLINCIYIYVHTHRASFLVWLCCFLRSVELGLDDFETQVLRWDSQAKKKTQRVSKFPTSQLSWKSFRSNEVWFVQAYDPNDGGCKSFATGWEEWMHFLGTERSESGRLGVGSLWMTQVFQFA